MRNKDVLNKLGLPRFFLKIESLSEAKLESKSISKTNEKKKIIYLDMRTRYDSKRS